MESKSVAKFTLVVLVIALLAYIAACGLTIGNFTIPRALDPDNGIRRGLDLAGGSTILFEAQTDTVADGDMDAAQAVLRNRLDNEGLYEATISQLRNNKKRIQVEIPSITNTDEAVALLGAMVQLEFKDKDGNVIMTGGEDVKNATAAYEAVDSTGTKGYIVKLQLTGEGQKKFAEATDRISKYTNNENFIAITLDGNQISAPLVHERIDSDSCHISGNFTQEEAKKLAGQIQSGQLPFTLEKIEARTISPQLGERALENSILAGGIGLLLVFLFMLVMYRMNGLMANIALIAYISIVAIILAVFRKSINLTLPGIAGIILTIGTAVDANVIIFERIKEELSVGKTLRASVDAGFKRAFSAILDANVTTIIAAVVLFLFGTGTIKGFAITLFIGTIVSMFTAIVITRFLLRQMIGFNIKNPKLYSAFKGGKQNV